MDPILLKKQLTDNANDIQDFCKDLQNWGNDMKAKDESLRKKGSEPRKLLREGSESKQVRPKVTDYSKWDKFDADLECERVEGDYKDDSELTDEFEDEERDKALVHKEKGNSYVKSKNWAKAIECYTAAIACYQYDPIFYANRALCHLKLSQFELAETDCTFSLRLDGAYVKALQRRAAAREALGKHEAAQTDLELVLTHEPKNAESLRALELLKKKTPQTQRPVSKFTASRKPIVTSTILKQNWPDVGEIVPVKAIEKPVQLRSKKPLKRIQIVENEPFKRHVVERVQNEAVEVVEKKSKNVKNIENISKMDSKLVDSKMDSNLVNSKMVDSKLDSNLVDSKQILIAPKTSIQFQNVWKTLKNNSQAKYDYLKLIEAAELPNIFQESMDSKVFSDILEVLAQSFIKNGDEVYGFLSKLSEVKRFAALTMFMDSTDKNHLWKLIGYLREQKAVPGDQVDQLIKIYEL